ncbi:MAG: rhomboid family intramembrane serine protease [Pirellulales bacterium]|nr:rhomboid family intramembrane serine protease [Pirellulales bacterium]
MFLFFPYNTDAPVYSFPYATVGLIVLNTAIHLLCFGLAYHQADAEAALFAETLLPWTLQWGDGLHPVQWLTSNFVHGGWAHLIGNMVFLWPFGLIVEGKLGWWRFLLVYLLLGVAQSGIEQSIMLAAPGGNSFGASAIIFGLVAMALVWAPKNDLYCFLFVFLFFRPIIQTVEVQVWVFALGMAGYEFAFAALAGFGMETPVLHLMGFGLGLPVAIIMLRLKLVDCEGWDVFTVWQGKTGVFADQPRPEAKPVDERKLAEARQETQNKIDSLMAQSQPRLALAVHRKAEKTLPDWQLPEPSHRALAAGLEQQQAYDEFVALAVDYLRLYPDKQVRMRLKLAQVLIYRLQRPGQALVVLQKLPAEGLPPDFEKIRRGLIKTANHQRATGEHLELAPHDW